MKLITFVFCILFLNSAFSQSSIHLKTYEPFFDARDNDKSMPNYIEINSVDLGFYRDDALASPPGSGASRSNPELLTIRMPFGHSTISLFKNMLERSVGTNLEIVFQMTNQHPTLPNLTYQKFQFGPFVVASVEPDGGRTVVIAIQFSKVFIENYEFLKDGTLGPKTSSGWDYVENKTWGGF
jgi:hypothetical protein